MKTPGRPKRRDERRQLRRLIAAWSPVVGTAPRHTGDLLAQVPVAIASTLKRRFGQ